MNININLDRLKVKLKYFEYEMIEMETKYPFMKVNGHIDKEKFKEWLVEDVNIERVSVYGDNEIVKEVTTIHL